MWCESVIRLVGVLRSAVDATERLQDTPTSLLDALSSRKVAAKAVRVWWRGSVAESAVAQPPKPAV
jgi:hypothetical protein